MDVIVYLNARCKEIMKLLTVVDKYMTIAEIAKAKGVSRRSIYNDLGKINEWLEYNGIEPIEVERGKGICLTSEQRQGIAGLDKQSNTEAGYVFSPDERVRSMICLIGMSREVIRIEDLMEFGNISRNTVFNDLKMVSARLQKYHLELSYEKRQGYKITGDHVRRRTVCLYYFHSIFSLFREGSLKIQDRAFIDRQLERFHFIENSLNIRYPEETLLGLAALLPIMEDGRDVLDFRDIRIQEVVGTREFAAVAEHFPHLIESEQIYLAVHLLGSRLQVSTSSRENELHKAARSLMSAFEKESRIHFEYNSEAEQLLFMHLKNAWYRMYYGVKGDGMSLLQEIISPNVKLFETAKKACRSLEDELGLPISDDEVACLALCFDGYTKRSWTERKKLRILIICAQGVTLGFVLRWEIGALLPDAKVVDVVTQLGDLHVKDICDVVISTASVECDVPTEVVHPIMTDKEKLAVLRLGELVAGTIGERAGYKYPSAAFVQSVSTHEIMEIVQKYVPETAREELSRELDSYLSKKLTVSSRYGLIRYLTVEKIRLCDRELGWREALSYTAQPLLDFGSIELSYVSGIISIFETLGSYMFFAPGVVLAHAKPDDGVNSLDVSVGIFRRPVQFSHNRYAKIIILLAPIDWESHLEILRDIMRVFSVQTRIDDLWKKSSALEVLEFLEYCCCQNEEESLEE